MAGRAAGAAQAVLVAQAETGLRRELNEDTWRIADLEQIGSLLDERGQLFAVADGMGGHAAGEVASHNVGFLFLLLGNQTRMNRQPA